MITVEGNDIHVPHDYCGGRQYMPLIITVEGDNTCPHNYCRVAHNYIGGRETIHALIITVGGDNTCPS
jgi:hypothetical protein